MPVELTEEEGLERIPDLRLSQWLFQASLNRTTAKSRSFLINLIMDVIKAESALNLLYYLFDILVIFGIVCISCDHCGLENILF